MSNVTLYQNSINRLAEEADAIGRLAQDEGAFAAVVAAFDSQDPDAFRWVLGRLEILPHCELICEWVRIKLCVLRCAALCGPPREEVESPSLEAFARAVVRLAGHERQLDRLVAAVSCGDATAYRAIVAELELEPFCHLLCRYLCGVIYRRVCEIICSPVFVPRPDPVSDIRADAEILRRLSADDKALALIARSAATLDGDSVKAALAGIGLTAACEIVCRLICTWRCVWVTRLFCRRPSPILTGAYAVEEARNFALALRPLAVQPRALGTLVAAIEQGDVKYYDEIVARFGLGLYCEQLSTWVCSIVCGEFCYRICPPPELLPDFFKIGGLDFQTQIDSALPATGLTIGGTQAFYGSLRLNGILTQTYEGQPMEYTFEYLPVRVAATTLAAPVGPADTVLSVASSAGFPAAGPFNVSLGGAHGGYEIVTVTGVSGTHWTVLRGQQGTAALPAAIGAAIVTGAAAAGAWTQVPQAWIERTVIAYQETIVGFPFPHIDIHYFTVNGNPAVETVVGFTPDGWIPVPQGTNIALTNDMIVLNSAALAAFAANDETGVVAGAAANPLRPTDLYFGLRMRVRQQGSTVAGDGGTCGVIAIDNALYNNIDRHPEWAGGVVSGQYGVAMLDIKELQGLGNGCKGITDQLSVLFTASHPNLGPVTIGMVGGTSGPYGFTLPTPLPQTGNWYGTAINDFSVADLEPCAYLVTLNVSLLLTNGDTDFPNPLVDQFAFCAS